MSAHLHPLYLFLFFEKSAQPERQAQLQNILLENCILVAGEAAIAQSLDDATRTQLHDALQLEMDGDAEMDGDEFVYVALSACLDRCLENSAQCSPDMVAPFLRIVLARGARMPCTLTAWRQRLLRTTIGGPTALMRSLSTHDVRDALKFIDLLLMCGCDISSIMRAVDGSDMSAHYHRLAAHALRRLSASDAVSVRSSHMCNEHCPQEVATLSEELFNMSMCMCTSSKNNIKICI